MALSAKAQARLWQALFVVVAFIGLVGFRGVEGEPLGLWVAGLGTVCWVAVTAILNYHKG